MPEPSARALYLLGRAVLIRRRPGLLVSDGDISDSQLWSAAAMCDLVIGRGAADVAATYLTGATGAKLTQLAADHWGEDRLPAVAAIGEITFSRPGSGGSGTISAGTRVATVPAAGGAVQIVVTTADAVFAAPDTSKTVAAVAELTGRDGNVAPATVTQILDTLFETGFSATNAERFAGGAEEESDPDLVARIQGLNQTLRRATRDALVTGALEVDVVRTASIVEDAIAGTTSIYVADADGGSNGAMETAVETELENWRAYGIQPIVTGGALFAQAVDVSLVVRAGASPGALATRVREAVVAAVNQLQIGDTLYRSLIRAAARAVDPAVILEVAVNVPATNIAPSANELIRAAIGTTSVS